MLVATQMKVAIKSVLPMKTGVNQTKTKLYQSNALHPNELGLGGGLGLRLHVGGAKHRGTDMRTFVCSISYGHKVAEQELLIQYRLYGYTLCS